MVVKRLKRGWWHLISCGLRRSKHPSRTPLPSVDHHEKFEKARKVYNSFSSDDLSPLPRRQSKSTKSSRAPRRLSISSVESGFSTEDNTIDRAPLLIVQSNIKKDSTDKGKDYDSCSTDFNPHLETIREGLQTRTKSKKNKNNNKNKNKNIILMDKENEDDMDQEVVAGRLSAVLQRLMTPCGASTDKVVEGKVRDSLAVVKTSDEPYQDFRRSMLDMIVAKEMVEQTDLQELLRCFLSLNSHHHHPLIIRAFSDLCQPLFSL